LTSKGLPREPPHEGGFSMSGLPFEEPGRCGARGLLFWRRTEWLSFFPVDKTLVTMLQLLRHFPSPLFFCPPFFFRFGPSFFFFSPLHSLYSFSAKSSRLSLDGCGDCEGSRSCLGIIFFFMVFCFFFVDAALGLRLISGRGVSEPTPGGFQVSYLSLVPLLLFPV